MFSRIGLGSVLVCVNACRTLVSLPSMISVN